MMSDSFRGPKSAKKQGVSRRGFVKGAAAGGRGGGIERRHLARRDRGEQARGYLCQPALEMALRPAPGLYGQNKDVTIDVLVSPYAEHYQRIGTSDRGFE
jgi:hypothetical protein